MHANRVFTYVITIFACVTCVKTLSYYNIILKGFYAHYACEYCKYICKYAIRMRN